jgi:hypothetical protein
MQPRATQPGKTELFELSMLGGALERRYRRLRPEVERLPWGTLDPERYSAALVLEARRSWTEAAFQEHRTGAACAATLEALIAARAPLDLIAMASRFPLDELVHVELCARLAGELGGGVPIAHDPTAMIPSARSEHTALLRAAELVVRFFCIGEALSIPMLRTMWHVTTQPLIKGVLGRIVKDEAAHGQFGWIFLDWAQPELGADDLRFLGDVASETVTFLTESWRTIMEPPGSAEDIHALGWMQSTDYLKLARSSLQTHVLQPLAARGIRVA